MIEPRYKYETLGEFIAELPPSAFFLIGFIGGYILAGMMFG
jgi:hypothetical protein